MNRLPVAKRAQILTLLCEGMSMRSVSRVVDCSINTVVRELIVAGHACAVLHDAHVQKVAAQRVQADEIWSFVGMKEKQAKAKGLDRKHGVGDMWTWTAIDADSKLIISWLVGGRDAGYAYEFMCDVAARLANRVQLTTDGHRAYLSAVGGAFGEDIDYAMLVKLYGESGDPEHRYSPAICIGCESQKISGEPDKKYISTSYIERSNLTLRMSNRRFTRLTNAFSKKLENHVHMISLYTLWYNFCRVHKTLRVTPAMEAKLTDHVWDVERIIEAMDAWEADQPRQKPGRKAKAVAAE
jgi:IS1 family transposase